MFTLSVDIDGLVARFETLAISAADLEAPLGKFGAYLRKRAIERYKAQDFAPLAPSTIEKRTQRGLRRLERKLHVDLRKALRRESAANAPRGLLARLFGAPSDPALVGKSRGAQSRMSVLREFQRQHRQSGSLAERLDLKELTLKQHLALGSRTDRALAKAVGAPILGRLVKGLMVEVGAGSVTLVARTATEFSEVHNKGGTAGHGAVEPKRETVVLEQRDLDVLAAILVEDHLLPAFNGAA